MQFPSCCFHPIINTRTRFLVQYRSLPCTRQRAGPLSAYYLWSCLEFHGVDVLLLWACLASPCYPLSRRCSRYGFQTLLRHSSCRQASGHPICSHGSVAARRPSPHLAVSLRRLLPTGPCRLRRRRGLCSTRRSALGSSGAHFCSLFMSPMARSRFRDCLRRLRNTIRTVGGLVATRCSLRIFERSWRRRRRSVAH